MGAFIDFLGNIFGKKSDGKVETISLKDYLIESESDRLCVDTYALWSAVEMLANLLANAEIKVYKRGVEEKGLLWAKLNYRPNVNQNATEFWREFYRKLLYTGEALAFETYDEQWLIADGFNVSDARGVICQLSERERCGVKIGAAGTIRQTDRGGIGKLRKRHRKKSFSDSSGNIPR